MRPPFSLLLVLGLSVVPPAAAQIHAERGSVAIGGNVVDSTVVLGVTQERVDELVRERTRPLELLTGAQRQTIGLLQEKLDLNEKQLRAAQRIGGTTC